MLSSSSALVKLPLLPRGLLSYLPTSILPSGRESTATSTATADAPSTPPPPPSPKKMSSSSSSAQQQQQQQAGDGGISSSKKAADSAELARVFELFDKNGDGRITREELEESLGKLGMSVPGDELAAMIARIDANGDGCVDVEEFGALYRAIMAGDNSDKKAGAAGEGEAAGGEEADEDMREAFRVFDANGDGYITVDELGAVLSSLGLKQGRTAEECRRMIGHVDRDGDGRVNYTEFRQMMRAGGLATLG